MNNHTQTNKTNLSATSFLVVICLLAVSSAPAQDGSDFRDVIHADDNPNTNSDFREVECDDCEYDDSSDEDEPKAKLREEDWKYDDVLAREQENQIPAEEPNDPQYDEYDPDSNPGQFSDRDGAGSSLTGAGSTGDEYEYRPGWQECKIAPGLCYYQPDSFDEEERAGSTSHETEPDSGTSPDQGYSPNPYESNRSQRGSSPIASPFARGSGGNAFGSGQSPYSSSGGAFGSTFDNNNAASDPNAVTTDCRRSLQAAGNAMTSCATPNSQQGICAISQQLARCS